jgi:hypothetical protein
VHTWGALLAPPRVGFNRLKVTCYTIFEKLIDNSWGEACLSRSFSFSS